MDVQEKTSIPVCQFQSPVSSEYTGMKLSLDVLTRYALNFSMSPTRVTDMLSRAVDAWITGLRKFHRLPVSYKVRCVHTVAPFLTYTAYT